jgi:hypothetical protein
MTPFVKSFVTRTIKGMLSSLKGCDNSERIEIHIEEGKD